jgi:hypothetical protein
LSDVLRCIEDIFSGIGNATPIRVVKQEHIKSMGVMKAPFILCAPDAKGEITDPPTGTGGMQYACGIAHGCNVYVRAEEGGEELGRLDAAYALADLFISALDRACRGRWNGREYKDDSPSGVDAIGADIMFSFVYMRGVQSSPKVWALPASPIAASPPNISAPPGSPPSTVEVSYTESPQ